MEKDLNRSQIAALKAFPPKFTSPKRYAKRVQSELVDTHKPVRAIFQQGYEMAEKDLALTQEDVRTILDKENDILHERNDNAQQVIEVYPKREDYYGEILKRYNEQKNQTHNDTEHT